jgi:hypothetical protein
MSISRQVLKLSVTLQILVSDCVKFCVAGSRSRTALAAENLFLRKQLALFKEREKKAVPTTAADRFVLSKLARFFDRRSALVIVKPATLIGWHRAAFRRFWHWKSRPVGRPPVSAEVRCIPDRVQQAQAISKQPAQLSSTSRVITKAILGGLHHEYRWAEAA